MFGRKSNKGKNNRMLTSIYDRSKPSRFNNGIISLYNLFFKLSVVLLFLALALEIFGTRSYTAAFIRNIYGLVQAYIRYTFSKEIFTLFSVIISLLSVMAAAFSIAFGNFNICSINANLVLKQIYGKGRSKSLTKIIISMLATPLLLLLSIGFHLNILFIVTFLIAFINLFYMLDICLTVFTDNGVKYVAIPKNISRELQQNVHLFKNSSDSMTRERERLLYDSFVQNISCDDYSVNKIVVPSVVLNLLDLKYIPDMPPWKNCADAEMCPGCDKRTHAIYRNTYCFFYDIRKYLYRNTEHKRDFLNVYFSLCHDTITALMAVFLSTNDSIAGYMGAAIAIFRSIVDSMNMDASLDYSIAFNDGFTELLNDLNSQIKRNKLNNSADGNRISDIITVVVLNIIFQLEYELDIQKTKEDGLLSTCNHIKDTVNLLFDRVYSDFSFMVKNKGTDKSDMDEVTALMNRSKNIVLYLSSGMLDKEYIHHIDTQKILDCVDRVIHDLNLYIMHDSLQSHASVYLMSTFVFIYEAFLRGGSIK